MIENHKQEILETEIRKEKGKHRHVQFSLENNQTYEFEKSELEDSNTTMDQEGNSVPQNGNLSTEKVPEHKEKKKKKKKSKEKEEKSPESTLVPTEERVKQELIKQEEELDKVRRQHANEVEILNAQLATFKLNCAQEIAQLQRRLKDQKHITALELDDLDRQVERKRKKREAELEREIKEIESNKDLIYRHKEALELEQSLIDKEDELAERQKSVMEYEKEIENIEGMLERRMQISKRKENDLRELDGELGQLKQDLEKEKDVLRQKGVDVDSREQKAKLGWELLRRGLVDKNSKTELALKKCRTDLEDAQAKIKEKDAKISFLNKEIEGLKHEIEKKNTHIKTLESHLTMTIDEVSRSDPAPGGRRLSAVSVTGDINNLTPTGRRLSVIQGSQEFGSFHTPAIVQDGGSTSGSSNEDNFDRPRLHHSLSGGSLNSSFNSSRREFKRGGSLKNNDEQSEVKRSMHERGRRYTLGPDGMPVTDTVGQSRRTSIVSRGTPASPTKKDNLTKFEYEKSGSVVSSSCAVM